jgi:hypothetical protein
MLGLLNGLSGETDAMFPFLPSLFFPFLPEVLGFVNAILAWSCRHVNFHPRVSHFFHSGQPLENLWLFTWPGRALAALLGVAYPF